MELVARLIGNRELTGFFILLAMIICFIPLLAFPDEWKFAKNLEDRPYTGRGTVYRFTF